MALSNTLNARLLRTLLPVLGCLIKAIKDQAKLPIIATSINKIINLKIIKIHIIPNVTNIHETDKPLENIQPKTSIDTPFKHRRLTQDRQLVIQPAFTAFTFIIFILSLMLSAWQWHRMDQKARYLEQARLQQTQPIKVTGWFSKDRMYLDNVIVRGKVGYEVIQPFHLSTQSSAIDAQNTRNMRPRILVNRGWLVGYSDRNRLPNLLTTSMNQQSPQSSSTTLSLVPAKWSSQTPSPNLERLSNGQYRIQALNAQIMQQLSLPPLYYKATHSTNGLTTDHWQEQLDYLTPEKHLGYAIQWLALGTLGLIVWFVSSYQLRPTTSHHTSKDDNINKGNTHG